MRIDSREVLAVGILGGHSRVGDRIEILLRRGRTISPRASATGIGTSTFALCGLLFAGSLAPRWIAFAQRPRPAFEVASVKPAGPDERLMYRLLPGGRYIATGVTLKTLIGNAYMVPERQVSGGPGWRDSGKYNIEARVGRPLPPWPDTNKQLSLMLQVLLEDRFKLALHRETREEPVYELTAARGSARLKPAKADVGPGFGIEPGSIRSMAVPLEYLAGNLAYVLGRPVIDKTGLEGKYTFTVTYTPDDAPPGDAVSPSIFTALQEQLGLQLKSAKGPVEYLVSIARSNPSAFQADSFQQVSPLILATTWRGLSGCCARTLAATSTIEVSAPMSGGAARKSARATFFRRLSVALDSTGSKPVVVNDRSRGEA